MKIVFISDTHQKHEDIPMPIGDCLVHCGDFTNKGGLNEVIHFTSWLKKQDYAHKIIIAGNHDLSFENRKKKEQAEGLIQEAGAFYLNDSGIELEGLKFWGSPIQPSFNNWAFNRARGQTIKKHWDLIPDNTDILITHGPPFNILDLLYFGENFGCQDLLNKIKSIRPRIHAFGHIHEAYGIEEKDGTLFINASNLNRQYVYANPPITIDITNV